MPRAGLLAILLAAPFQDKPEETVAAERGDLTPVVELEGVFEAVESAEVKAHFDAFSGDLTIKKAAAHGSAVKRGDVLLEVDRTPLERQIAAAQNEVRGVRAAFDKSKADLEIQARADAAALAQAEGALKDAESALKSFQDVEGRHMLENADLMVRYTEEAITDQKEELDQLLKMYKTEELTNATSEIVVRRTRRQLERTETQLRMQKAEAQLVRAIRHPQAQRQHEQQLAQARSALESLRAQQTLGRIQREVEAVKAEATLRQQEEQLEKLCKDLARFPWTAPLDGTVYLGSFQGGQWSQAEALSASLKPGEKLAAGQVLFTVCGAATRVRADVGEADVFEIRVGQAAEAAPAADPSAPLAGKVTHRASAPLARGQGGAFEARVEFAEPPLRLLPGMKARLTVKAEPVKGAVLVPNGAIQSAGPKTTVTVHKDGKPEVREIVAGRSDGTRTVVRSGLQPGERVVVQK